MSPLCCLKAKGTLEGQVSDNIMSNPNPGKSFFKIGSNIYTSKVVCRTYGTAVPLICFVIFINLEVKCQKILCPQYKFFTPCRTSFKPGLKSDNCTDIKSYAMGTWRWSLE
jgi:hypothetical protein